MEEMSTRKRIVSNQYVCYNGCIADKEDLSKEWTKKIDLLETKINKRILEIDRNLRNQINYLEDELNRNIMTRNESDSRDKLLHEQINKLSHAIYYTLKQSIPSHDTQACMEMVATLMSEPRPFSGETIRNRERMNRLKNYCIFFLLGLFSCFIFIGMIIIK
ncbi:unnamed protein product [Rotaria socialis]